MQVREVMTTQPHWLKENATIREVAQTMRNNKTGFEPLTDKKKVVGVLTDRDIVVRALAEGKSPDDLARSIATERVLYTYQDVDIEEVVQNMAEQKVQRLLVLNNKTDKDLVGVVTIGDIADQCKDAEMARKVVNATRHYQ
ncbi:CBS domain-containing protein [Pseudidiomarina sp.]|uniref:CBS domain-containing protein n=1 Tax=Pseudidiomarina sp. TaxID=2081707 RepID=UPI00299DBE95|nr:CBS domain-containing protein [Pseudidiomarina sp.]MDX1706823.1 CBS domain-containing protein [Pseudidiomarina sp.]